VRRLASLLVLVVASLIALPALADPKAEKDAQALQKKAIEEDSLNVNYPAAVKKLESALGKCGGSKCNPGLVATLTRDLGAMQILNGSVDEGKASFGKAIALDASLDLDPSYKNPMLSGIWAEVKKKGGGGGGGGGAAAGGGGAAAGGGGGPPSAGDFAHSPVPEAPVRTPLPIYAEYTGSEELKRVIVKYQGPGMSEWKTLKLKKGDSGYTGLISCKDVAIGDMKYFIQGFDAQDNPIATSGSKNKPYVVPVKQDLDGPPPSLPGEDPPKQCGEGGGGGGGSDDCPPGMEGCSPAGKDAGEACEKDKDCKSHSCQENTCAEAGKEFGDDCQKDGECKSGSCQDNKCAAGGNKKGPGDDCDSDDQCDSGKCQDDKCTEGSSGGKFPRVWLGFGLQLDMYLLPGGDDVCKLDNSAAYTTAYSCIASPQAVDLTPFGGGSIPVNGPFPSTTKSGQTLNTNIILSSKPVNGVSYDQVSGGFKIGNLRILASLDYALSQNALIGLRAGYVLFTDPTSGSPSPPFFPGHVEGRFTYLVGKNPLTKGGIAPMFFGGVGAGEFDAYLPVAVAVTPPPSVLAANPKAGDAVYGANAWTTAGPLFLAGGAGVRIGLGQKVAATGALKLELGIGGTAGALFGVAPEIGMQFGL
jgi:hypothetical protein